MMTAGASYSSGARNMLPARRVGANRALVYSGGSRPQRRPAAGDHQKFAFPTMPPSFATPRQKEGVGTDTNGQITGTATSIVPDQPEDRNAFLSSQILAYQNLERGWDGEEGAIPTGETVDAALAFIDLLPLGANPKGTMLEGTGEIGFYWKSKTSYIDITFDGRDIVFFAKLLPTEGRSEYTAKGRHPYTGKSLPRDLIRALTLV